MSFYEARIEVLVLPTQLWSCLEHFQFYIPHEPPNRCCWWSQHAQWNSFAQISRQKWSFNFQDQSQCDSSALSNVYSLWKAFSRNLLMEAHSWSFRLTVWLTHWFPNAWCEAPCSGCWACRYNPLHTLKGHHSWYLWTWSPWFWSYSFDPSLPWGSRYFPGFWSLYQHCQGQLEKYSWFGTSRSQISYHSSGPSTP